MSMNPRHLQQIRSVLVRRRASLANRKESIEHALHRQDEPLAADFGDQAVQTENDQPLDAIGTATSAQLLAVDEALRRIDTGGYGLCKHCGCAIAVERLEALPYATSCMTCQTQQDRAMGRE